MHTLRFLEDARIEFQETVEWYETRSLGLGKMKLSINVKEMDENMI